jgi:hypothetical protein
VAEGRRGHGGAISVEAPVHLSPMHGLEDGIDDIAGSRDHVGIPESQDAKTFRSQIGIAARIISHLVNMLTAIKLYDDSSIQTHEIADVRTD